MKRLKHINEFLKIYENSNQKLFLKEAELKEYLMKSPYFADGEVLLALSNIGYDKYKNDKDWKYENVIKYSGTFGLLPEFAVYFGNYDAQVCNGGHSQYFYNGYASLNSSGIFANYTDTHKHENFVELFKELNFIKLPSGQIAYNIISSFYYEDEEDDKMECYNCSGHGELDCSQCDGISTVECDECYGAGEDDEGDNCNTCNGTGNVQCGECHGDGNITCEDCDGDGQVEDEKDDSNPYWDNLNDQWFQINNQIESEIENYIKSLTLEGEKISDLIEQAKETQKFNI